VTGRGVRGLAVIGGVAAATVLLLWLAGLLTWLSRVQIVWLTR
jgi:hypothetical protein